MTKFGRLSFITLMFLLLTMMQAAYAKEYWSMNSASILYGSHFAVPYSTTSTDKSRVVLTLEHASTNSWGDLFAFLDTERSLQTQNNNMYGEITPRFSFYKLFDHVASKEAVVKDVLAALNVEAGINPNGFNFVNYLIGPGLSLNLPQFNFLNVNFLRRFNQPVIPH